MKVRYGTAALLAGLSGMCFGQDRVKTYWDGATSGMFEDESLWRLKLPNWQQYNPFGQQSPMGSDIWVSSTVDYDIHIEDTGSRREFRTVVEELEIAENATVSGFNFWVRPFVQNGINGSFVNYGTIRGDGGDVRVNGTTNFGTIHANGGEIEYIGNNFGRFLVTENALFLSTVLEHGSEFIVRNHGLIEVRGEGAIYQVETSGIRGQTDRQDYWANNGTLRVTDSGTARLGRMVLSDLGTIERDSSARIEITGLFDLEGQTINADTFHGDAWLTYGYPGFSGPDRGEITNGTIDLTGNWLHFGNFSGFITHSTVIGGDIVLDPALHGEAGAGLVIDDIDIINGGIVLAENSVVTFAEQTVIDGMHYYNQSITTLHNSGEQAWIGVSRGRLHLGKDALISGHVQFGIGSYTTRKIFNEGTILSTALSGRLDLYANTENHGLIMIQDNEMISGAHILNESDLIFDNSDIRLYSIENHSILNIINGSTLRLSRDLVLSQDSILTIDANNLQPSITLFGTLELGGILNLHLDAISRDGNYQLFDADTTVGDFDTINIFGLMDGLTFFGLDTTTGYYTIIPSPGSIGCLGFGILALSRRRR